MPQLPLSSPLLTVGDRHTLGSLHYQILQIDLTAHNGVIVPHVLSQLALPDGIDTTGGVIISGRAPIWLYAYLVHQLHPTAWVACHDPRLGAVVVATHSQQTHIGHLIPQADLPSLTGPSAISPTQPLTLNPQNLTLNPALMIVGPPDSGKTVFSHALFTTLLPDYPDIFLQRAHWDGEGNWLLELPDSATDADREAFKQAYKGIESDRFFPYHADAILNLRQQKRLVIVDVGGLVHDQKLPLLDVCSHYLIISSQRQNVTEWHEFCRNRGKLIPLAVIHSTLECVEQIHQQTPFLEMTCGPWLQGRSRPIPTALLDHLYPLLSPQLP